MNSTNKDIEISTPSSKEEWEKYYHFRWEQLRKHWNQPRGSERDEFENTAHHIFALLKYEEKVIGTGRIHFPEDGMANIRYMAVHPSVRKSGIGRKILAALESKAREMKCKEVRLNAREQAIPFYRKCGYEKIKEAHLLYGSIQHYLMAKGL